METAKKNALDKAACFGILFNANDIENSEMNQRERGSTASSTDTDFDIDIARDSDDELIVEEDTSNIPSSPFLDIIDSDGNTRQVRKSTFIWSHTVEIDKPSSDRLKRVQGTSNVKRRKIGSSGASSSTSMQSPEYDDICSEPSFIISNEIMIGDWVIFDLRSEAIPLESKDEVFTIGIIIGFRCIDENNRPKQYKSDYVSVKDHGQKKILVLGIWYRCNENGLLKQISKNVSLELMSYQCTIKSPIAKTEEGKVSYILPFKNAELENIKKNILNILPSSSSS